MYAVGIDVSKGKSNVAILTTEGEIIEDVKVNIKMHKKLKIKMYNFFTQFVWVQLILNLF